MFCSCCPYKVAIANYYTILESPFQQLSWHISNPHPTILTLPYSSKKQISSIKSFQLWILFCTGVFSHLGMSVILQIITGHVGRTVVEVYMNILSVLHNLQCLVFPITIKDRVSIRNFRHPFLGGLLCSSRTWHWWVKPCVMIPRTPDSMMGKTLFPYWMIEACLNWLCCQAWVEIAVTHARGTFPFHPLGSWSFLWWGHFLQPLGWVVLLPGC